VEHIIRGEDGAERDGAQQIANGEPAGVAQEIAEMLR